MRRNNKLLYISETNFPNDSASSIAILKMCASFSKFTDTDLLALSCTDKLNKIKRDFMIKEKFQILSFFKKPKKISFFIRLICLYKIIKKIKSEKYKYIFSRSPFISTFLSFLGHRNVLEFHHPNTGITKWFFYIYQKIYKNKFQRFVLINENINKKLKISKNKYIVLDTCIDLNNFRTKSKLKRKSCVYTGSLFKGKGFETVYKLAKLLKDIDFYVYGNINFLDKKNYNFNLKNLKIFPYQKYRNIPKIIKSHKICLLPYSKRVHVRSSSITTENYMSPIKLFEYLACRKVIIGSQMKVYQHILKNDYNCYLINSDNIYSWSKKIQYVFKNYSKTKNLRNNAYFTSKNYDIEIRAKKILILFDKFLNQKN